MDIKTSKFFLSVREIAELLAISQDTVRRIIGRHDLRAHQFGRSIRVSSLDVDQYVQRCALVKLDPNEPPDTASRARLWQACKNKAHAYGIGPAKLWTIVREAVPEVKTRDATIQTFTQKQLAAIWNTLEKYRETTRSHE